MCDVKKLQALARKHNLKLIFDAAHAFGSTAHGVRAGNFGDAEVFSCSPIKILTTGEGGVVATNNDELAQFCLRGRNYGDDGTNNTLFAGLSARMSEFHAAIGLRSFVKLGKNLKDRGVRAQYLISHLKNIEPGLQFQSVPADSTTTTRYILAVFIDPTKLGYTRDDVHAFFQKQGIATRKYFYPPLHIQETYKRFAPKKGSLPVTERISQNILSLPLYSHMSKEEMNRVIKTFRDFKSTITRAV
jgi:dTDP-4-amino-4,6-dideoxygalactose transaminase